MNYWHYYKEKDFSLELKVITNIKNPIKIPIFPDVSDAITASKAIKYSTNAIPAPIKAIMPPAILFPLIFYSLF